MRTIVAAIILLASCQASGEAGPAEGAGEYALELRAPGTVRVGQQADVTLTITPKAPWVLKTETPFLATMKGPAELKVDKTQLVAKDFVDPKAAAKTVKTGVVAGAAGEHTVTADVSFFLCTPEICKRTTAKATTKVVAQ